MTTDTRVLAKATIVTPNGNVTMWTVTDDEMMSHAVNTGIVKERDILLVASTGRYVTYYPPAIIPVAKEDIEDLLFRNLRLIHPDQEAEIAVFFGWKSVEVDPPPRDGESFYAFVPSLYDKDLNPDAVVECTHVEDDKDGYYVAAVWNDKTRSYDSKVVVPSVWREISSPLEANPREFEIYQQITQGKA